MLENIELIPITNEDYQFGYDIKKITLGEHIEKTWGKWNEEEQINYYKKEFSIDNCFLISWNKIKIGWLKIIENDEKIEINLILILPEYQGKGIGGKIINDIIKIGREKNKYINLQVLKCNENAKKLYEKMGFEIYEENKTHYLLKINGK
jgi:ribosomal protein S18 acetylase RimI-like enzyme